jgi:GH25 family lysozyme M1 (1,4-beta-N-acetylmuramidase)
MPDYTLGVDISHFEQRPSFQKLIDDGARFIAIKAWQGNSPDPDFEWARQQAEDNNLPWWGYIFDIATDTEASVQKFAAELGKGSYAMLDWEQQGVTNKVIDMAIDVLDAEGMNSIVYRGKYPPDAVTPKIASKPWFYAQYPSDPNALPAVPLWDGTQTPDWSKECAIWQYTGNGRLPGITTEIDLDRILMPLERLTTAWRTGVWSGTGAPQSTPQTPAQLHPSPAFSGAVLHLNSSGPDVTLLQVRLNASRPTPNPQIAMDGYFGIATLSAVKKFQASHGLTIDGIAGPATLGALS